MAMVLPLLLALLLGNWGIASGSGGGLCPTLQFFPNVEVECVSFPSTGHEDFYLQVFTKNMKDFELIDDPQRSSVKIHFDTPNADLIVTPDAAKFRVNQVVGVALDGVPIYSSLVDVGTDGLAPDMSTGVSPVVLDRCGGVYGPTGTELDDEGVVRRYHYRAAPACILDDSDAHEKRQQQTLDVHELMDAFTSEATGGRLGPQLLGYSLRGYPIFSPLNSRGLLQDALDSCNGKFNVTSSSSVHNVISQQFATSGATVEQPLASYGYYATPHFPYLVGCDGPGLYSTGELELPSVEMLPQRTGSKLASCPAGYVPTSVRSHTADSGPSAQYDNGCTPCPPGKYAASSYTKNRPLCSMDCPMGHYCPAASVSPIKCPGGRYGSAKNLQTNLCSGVCIAGHYCPEGSTSPTALPCGDEAFFCPVGSASRRAVLPGYYSTGDTEVSVGVEDSASRRTTAASFPVVDFRRRTSQSICPLGHYCVNGRRHKCPAGRYGSTAGLVNSTCAASPHEPLAASAHSTSASTGGSFLSSLCPVGYYCPEGSVSPIICPAGRYGSTTGLTTAECSGPCQAGFWCQAGSTSHKQNACPPGHYGPTEGLKTIDCNSNCEEVLASGGNEATTLTFTASALSAEGRVTDAAGHAMSLTLSQSIFCKALQCAAGYFCPAASTSATMFRCGKDNLNPATNATAYCPPGSSVPTRVSEGYYTVGEVHSLPGSMQSSLDVGHRVAQVLCEPGHYCVDGVRIICPKGYYGATAGLTSPTCSGQCDPGHYCHAGSNTPRQHSCKDASVYCPTGSFTPTLVPDGYYGTGRNDSSMATFSAIAPCPPGHFCVLGVIRPCEPGRYSATGSPSADCDGLCDEGYYCPVASTSPKEIACPAGRYGKHKGMINSDCTGSCDAGYYCPSNSTLPTQFECGMDTVFCPSGSAAPQPVSVGYYTTGGTARTRSDQSLCEITTHTGTPPSGPFRINKCPSTTATV